MELFVKNGTGHYLGDGEKGVYGTTWKAPEPAGIPLDHGYGAGVVPAGNSFS